MESVVQIAGLYDQYKDKQITWTGRIWTETVFAFLAILVSLAPALSTVIPRVPNSLLMAAATNTARADFPALASSHSSHGPVEVDIIVAPDGTVKEAQVFSGNILLWESLRAAALKWKFDPGKLHEEHDVIGTLIISFKPAS